MSRLRSAFVFLLCGASAACGLTSSTPESTGEDALDGSPPFAQEPTQEPAPEPERLPCFRGPIDTNSLHPSCTEDINQPKITLTDGFEFVEWDGWLLAERGKESQLFEFVDCQVKELVLPAGVAERKIVLTPLSASEGNALLSCDDSSCDAWIEAPASRTALDADCEFGGFEKVTSFPSGDLTALAARVSDEGSDLVSREYCAHNDEEIYCEFDDVPARLVPDIPIETVHFEPDRQHCLSISFFTRDSRIICYERGGWTEPEQQPIPPTFVETDRCEAVDAAYSFLIWAVDAAGTVFIYDPATGACEPTSEPLGAPVDGGTLGCQCSNNPVVLTKTEVFATFECQTCR